MQILLLLIPGVFVLVTVTLIILGIKNNQVDWGSRFANIMDGLIRVYCKVFHRQSLAQITIPTDRKLLIACNHISGLDPFILISATRRPIRFMIAKEEYEKPILHWLYKAAKCIPVDRSGRVESAFRETLKAIQAGELVGIFPQGGIHSEETPKEKIKLGIIKLSELSQCDILPVRIGGVGSPGNVFKCLLVRSHIQWDVHPLISPEVAKSEQFSVALTNWLLGKIDKIK